jgi:hypothetical protein
VLLASACTFVLAARAYVDFTPIRIRVVRTPVAATVGTVQVAVADERATGLRLPLALIARIRNDGEDPGRFAVRVDDADVCEAVVEAGDGRRIDCAVRGGWTPVAGHTVAVQGPASDWSLEYLELATHHGSSAGLLPFVVVPVESRLRGAGPWWLGAVWLALAVALVLPGPPARIRAVRALYRGMAALLALCLLLVALVPIVSEYRVAVDAGWLTWWLGVLVVVRLAPTARRGLAMLERSHPVWRWNAACALVGVLGAAVFSAAMSWRLQEEYKGNYSGFLHLGRRNVEANPMLGEDVLRSLVIEDDAGYDAQFMYAAVYDPFVIRYGDDPHAYSAFIDAAPYRYGRIGFPLLTKILSADRWTLYPATMVWSILGAIAVCGFVLARMAREAGASPAWGGLVLLVPGTWRSLQTTLPEPIAMAVLLCGYVCVLKRRWTAAGLLFGFSLLVRETGVILVTCLAAFTWMTGQRREALRLVVLGAAPLALWRVYLGWVFFPEWGVRGFWYSPADFSVPFHGMADMWLATARGEYWPDAWPLRRGGVWFSVLTAAGFLLALALAATRRSAVTVAAAAYAALTITFNYEAVWVHVSGAERLTQELFMLLALASCSTRGFPPAWRAGLAAFWIAAGAYVFVGTYDAAITRQAIVSTLW